MLSNRQHCTAAIALLLGLVLATPRPSSALVLNGLQDEDAAKAAVACQKQIGKAGETFIKKKQKKLDKCLSALFKCAQKKKTLNEQLTCPIKLTPKCEKELEKIFDKALSVGEGSTVTASDLNIDGVMTGIACKDGSELRLSNSTIQNVGHAGLMAYIKKPEYGPGTLYARNISLIGVEIRARAQTENTIFIDGAENKGGVSSNNAVNYHLTLNWSADYGIGGKDADKAQLPSQRFFDGAIDDVRLYSRLLSPKEVTTLYDGDVTTVAAWTEVNPNN